MDLNKDNKNIYTIDKNSYSKHMYKEKTNTSSFLNKIINILFIILLSIIVYFFFYIMKKDLTFSEVFNKKEWSLAYGFLYEKEEIAKVKEERKHEIVLAAFDIHEDAIANEVSSKKDVKKEPKEKVNLKNIQKHVLKAPLVEGVLPMIEQVVAVEEAVPSYEFEYESPTVHTDDLSSDYVDRIAEELNSL